MIAALPPVVCIIEHHKESAGAMTLIPTIESDGRREGTYQFEIFSNANGNTSSNVQGGDFQKDDPGRLALSRSTVSVSPNGWSARLTVYGPDGEKLCVVSVP
ncbi:curli-like amyloid fiber formation chaperone CsgH [Rhizobium grahamii]|uniref:Uncharacterized protein n=1 Tax=Rhizobium grahamii CCGE 502 TaxID=990285 RepID=S3IP03_9HYPH|nr:curli-like amyloid fiber formation chaperone CsgH [Rhizobium grahamii]EPF00344.1 hypothetical protein RGCCGE502_00270 [Rhizobium grahamii CCGE 502]